MAKRCTRDTVEIACQQKLRVPNTEINTHYEEGLRITRSGEGQISGPKSLSNNLNSRYELWIIMSDKNA